MNLTYRMYSQIIVAVKAGFIVLRMKIYGAGCQKAIGTLTR